MRTESLCVIAPAAAAGLRLDKFLAQWVLGTDAPEHVRGASRAQLQRWITDPALLQIDGKPARAASKLKGGERITLSVPPPVVLQLQPEAIPLAVLYEDTHLIVLNKPAGLVMHPGAGHAQGTLVNALLAHCGDLSGIGGVLRPGIVHRLDRETSGVLVVAKHDQAHLALAKQFARREVTKQYVAWVLGVPRPAHATLDTYYGRHPVHRKQFTARLTSGKRAVTTYEVMGSLAGISVLKIGLGTGRTHQIRVHLAEKGHPIVGDKLYGGRRVPQRAPATLKSYMGQLQRHALHAQVLTFTHPVTLERLTCEAPIPPELQHLSDLAQLPSIP